jgi:hypothetical protein
MTAAMPTSRRPAATTRSPNARSATLFSAVTRAMATALSIISRRNARRSLISTKAKPPTSGTIVASSTMAISLLRIDSLPSVIMASPR